MNGGFPIAQAPSSVTGPTPGPSSDIQTEAGFLEALTRSLGGVSAAQKVPTTTVTLSVPAEVATLALGFSGTETSGGTPLADPAFALDLVGEPAPANLPQSGTAALVTTAEPLRADSTKALGGLVSHPGSLESGATATERVGVAPFPDADTLQSMVDVPMLTENADEEAAAIESPDLAVTDGQSIASEAGQTSGAAFLTPEADSPPLQPENVPDAEFQSPQPPAAAISPFAFASATAMQPRAPLRSIKPPEAPFTTVEAVTDESLDLHHSLQARTFPRDGHAQPGELDAIPVNPDALPEFAALAASFVPPLTPRTIAQRQGPEASDATPAAGWPFEFGIAGPASQFSALPSLNSRPFEAAALPPMRQLAPIAIALAFTAGPANGFNLTLDPVELGRVEIRVQREADGHSVRIMAERPETLALLQRDRHELDRSLADAGLRVMSDGLEFSLENSGAGRDAPRDDGARQAARGRGGAGTAESQAEPSPGRASRGLLDLNI